MIVVKVGGSLYDHPHLGPGLRAYLDTLAPSPVLLVPGGGDFANAVRKLDTTHQLGEEASHGLALWAVDLAGEFLHRLLNPPNPPTPFPKREGGANTAPPSLLGKGVGGLGSCDFLDTLPHTWAVTSDSIAARAAVAYRAERLVLLKSIDIPPGTPWVEAAQRGWVDPHFPTLVADAPFPVEAINFRRWLDRKPL